MATTDRVQKIATADPDGKLTRRNRRSTEFANSTIYIPNLSFYPAMMGWPVMRTDTEDILTGHTYTRGLYSHQTHPVVGQHTRPDKRRTAQRRAVLG